MEFKIKNNELMELNEIEKYEFPKYTSQLINWANQNAQGTRPKIVGKLSDLFPEYEKESTNISIEGWKEWYLDKYPDSIKKATDKISLQLDNLKEAIKLIDRDMIQKWVEDLIIYKTYNGLYVQKAILSKIAEINKEVYRLATAEEESKGIDGYVGKTAYSIKPITYKTMDRLSETIDVKMIYYTKEKTGIKVEFGD